jgi:hypothetical protein
MKVVDVGRGPEAEDAARMDAGMARGIRSGGRHGYMLFQPNRPSAIIVLIGKLSFGARLQPGLDPHGRRNSEIEESVSNYAGICRRKVSNRWAWRLSGQVRVVVTQNRGSNDAIGRTRYPVGHGTLPYLLATNQTTTRVWLASYGNR